MHLLQVCNVGHICGGTAACAWSITRALVGWRHTVVCLSPATRETVAAFAPVELRHHRDITRALVRQLDPDVVLLHNTAAGRIEAMSAPLTIQYLHSRISAAAADVTVACSRWLRQQFPAGRVDGVLYQPVDVPSMSTPRSPGTATEPLVVGRLCTPHARKWPSELVSLYAGWASRHPLIAWEFVGCPAELTGPLREACRQRATFWPAEWSARRHLRRWDALLYHHPTLSETFGRTVAESLQAGCVPIVDDRGGFREQLDRGGGRLCRTVADFDAALTDLQRPAGLASLRSQAELIGRSRFSGAAFRARFLHLLRAAVTTHSAPTRR